MELLLVFAAGSDPPTVDDDALAQYRDLVHKVQGQAHMIGDHPQPLTEGWQLRTVGPADGGMVLGQSGNAGFGMVYEPSETGGPRGAVTAHNLAAGIQDKPAWRMSVACMAADDSCRDGQGNIVQGAPSKLQLLGISEDIYSGSDLGCH